MIIHVLSNYINDIYTDPLQTQNVSGLAESIVPVWGYGRHSHNQVMFKREWLTDEVLLSFSKIIFF